MDLRQEEAITVLAAQGRHDLATLLKLASIEFVERTKSTKPHATVIVPGSLLRTFNSIHADDTKEILTAVESALKSPLEYLQLRGADQEEEEEGSPVDELRTDIVLVEWMLIAYAVRKMRLPRTFEADYRYHYERLAHVLSAYAFKNPNPFPTLRDVLKHWVSANIVFRDLRVADVKRIYAALMEELDTTTLNLKPVPERGPTGWARVDRMMSKARALLVPTNHAEEFQQIGLLCRELLLEIAKCVYDFKVHAIELEDGKPIGPADAAKMLEAFFLTDAKGESNAKLRSYARAAVGLAHELTHKSTATYRAAALCLEATASVTHTVAIVCGRTIPVPLAEEVVR